ncbi:unnamed protein product, partial [Callosobruchus maculatus]
MMKFPSNRRWCCHYTHPVGGRRDIVCKISKPRTAYCYAREEENASRKCGLH